MKINKIVVALMMIVSMIGIVNAQTMEDSKFTTPDYNFTTPESCKPYNHTIMECVNWLENVSPNIFEDEQVKAKKFLIDWATVSNDASIIMDEKVVTFIKTSPDMLIYYIGGWVKKCLITKNKLFKSDYAYAGLQSVMNYYKRYNKLLKRDLNIEALIQKEEQGGLLIQLQKDMIKHDFR